MSTRPWSIGSRWLRWDPHLHAPGTLRNDQFAGDWDGYIERIEKAQPAPVALGVTDYFSLRTYKEVVRRRSAGALRSIPLIFPNIELRLTIETKDRQGINLHLLVSPEDPEHVARIEEKLGQLRFRYLEDWFPCNEEGLKRLGRSHRRDTSLPDHLALQEGANQFKVNLDDLRGLFDGDGWLRHNVIVAVAAGNDGLAGIAKDAAFHAQREELGRFADVVFSATPSDRAYWLGVHPDFASNGQTPKPCLHGSDAHSVPMVLQPRQDRRCWIRGEPTFDGLRQTLVEPERRTHIGEFPPPGPPEGNVVRAIRLKNASWVTSRDLLLNEGLVTVIGAKGSGKTALADLIAFGAHADEVEPGPASFFAKAGRLLHGINVELEWGDGQTLAAAFPRQQLDRMEPRVRYLSQQFVERLCAAGGLAEPLVEEIEGVVFSAIPDEERLQCSTFSELRRVVLASPTAERDAQRDATRTKTQQVAHEAKLEQEIPSLKTKLKDAERDQQTLEAELKKLPVNASDETVKAHRDTNIRLQALKDVIAGAERRVQELKDLAAEMQRQVRNAEASAQTLKERYPALLDEETWSLLRLRLHDDAIPTLTRLEREARERAIALRDHGLPLQPTDQMPPLNSAPTAGLTALTAEAERLSKELGLDQANAKRRVELDKKLTSAKLTVDKTGKTLARAQEATARKKAAQTERLAHYESVFDALLAEEQALKNLYEPLRQRIARDPRLTKLSFYVERVVDVDAWAARGESLLDLRKPPFNGRGTLAEIVRGSLVEAWKRATPQAVREAMSAFLTQYGGETVAALALGSTLVDLGEWLFSTEHIGVRYGIKYEGVDIAHLSPGTRGVVLLTLYLALDEWDQRPLVIDQPEENLDPRSVYADLVPFFRDAAKRRQIIMVTHNANLVVNTDSDQVIVAEAIRTSPTALPQVSYVAGGLEDPEIRAHVCRLLEGGEDAFRRRGQRYGVGL